MLNAEFLSVGFSSFVLIALAEIGDKSQLVCMTLAARYHHIPVLLGAIVAFLVLNALAVLFGVAVAAWIPERVMAALVAVIFAAFGIHAMRSANEETPVVVGEKSHHGVFMTTFLLIMVSEFGDKTQIAVAGMASSLPGLPVWVGASLALVIISAIGVWLGKTLLQKVSIKWLQRIGGVVFFLFAAMAAYRALY